MLDINLQKENGEILESVYDERRVLPKLLPRDNYSLLSGIDFYGDTTFNRLQMDLFLAEWSQLRKGLVDRDKAEMLDKVEKLAVKCRDGLHLYLKFIGD